MEIQCPRCGQPWYADEMPRGRERLCSNCKDYLDSAARRKQKFNPIELTPFFLAILGALLFDGFVIMLARFFPFPVRGVEFLLGIVAFGIGLTVLRIIAMATWLGFGEIDWEIGKWPALVALAGLALILDAAGAQVAASSRSAPVTNPPPVVAPVGSP